MAVELRRRGWGARVSLGDRNGGRGHQRLNLLDPRETARVIGRLRPSLVFHLAGTTRPLPWDALWRAHVTATINLLEALTAVPARGRTRIVLSGSSGEYGPPPGPGPVGETAPLRPLTLYGATKRAQCLAAASYRHRSLDVVEARIFNVLGPGIPPHLAPGAFAEQIARIERGLQKPRLAVGNLAAERDYLDIRDVAAALVDLGRSGRPGEAYNICSGRALPMGALLKIMLASARRPISVAPDAARARKVEVPRLTGCARKLRALTGWRPRVALEKSVADTLEWHRGRVRGR